MNNTQRAIQFPKTSLVMATVFNRRTVADKKNMKFAQPQISMTFENEKERTILELRFLKNGDASLESRCLTDFDVAKNRWSAYGAASSEILSQKDALALARTMLEKIEIAKLVKYSGSSHSHESFYPN